MMNISSIVIRTSPQHMDKVIESLKTSGLCDVYFHDEAGRIIVTIEGKDLNSLIKKVKTIQGMTHVLSAEVNFSYGEEELKNARKHFESVGEAVPEVLRDETADARNIFYGGDLK